MLVVHGLMETKDIADWIPYIVGDCLVKYMIVAAEG
jgi:hypothetical protein